MQRGPQEPKGDGGPKELKEDGAPCLSLGSGDEQEDPDKLCSDASRSVLRGKRKTKKKQNASTLALLDDSSPPASAACGLDGPSSPESLDTALPSGQPSQLPGPGMPPLPGGAGAAAGADAAGGPAAQDPLEGRDHTAAVPAVGRDLALEGPGSTTSACDGCPGTEGAAQGLLVPGDHLQTSRLPAAGAPDPEQAVGAVDKVGSQMKGTLPRKTPRWPASVASSEKPCQETETKDVPASTREKAKDTLADTREKAKDVPATSRERAKDAPATSGEKAKDTPATSGEKAKDMLAGTGEKAKDAPALTKGKAKDVPAGTREKAKDVPATSEEKAKEVLTGTREKAKDVPATSRERAKDVPATSGEKAKDMPATSEEKAKDMPADTGEKAKDVPADTGEKAKDVPADTGEKAKDVSASTKGKAKDTPATSGEKAKDAPATSGDKDKDASAGTKGKAKDTLALSGGKAKDLPAGIGEAAGKTEKAKPEGNKGSYAAAVKNEQRNQEAGGQDARASELRPGEGVTVYFHAIISKHFSYNPDCHKVFVRAGKELGRREWSDVCEMHYTRDLHNDGSLIEGSMVISRQHLDRAIPYKYFVYCDKGSGEYEFIYKRQKTEPVNRCLHVKSKLLGSGDWHQYDDIICMKPPGLVQKFMDYLTDSTRRDLVRGKQIAAAVMLDSIFSVLQPWSAVNLQSFFWQLQQFFSVVQVPMIFEGRAQPWHSLQYEGDEVKKDLWQYLKGKMAPFLGRREDGLPEGCPVRSAVCMGLIALFSLEKFALPISTQDLRLLCHLLVPDASSPDALRQDLAHILGASQSWRAFLVNLSLRCMEQGVESWPGTLPLLHCCMGLPPPTQGCAAQPEDTWAALEGISFSQFREDQPERTQLLEFMAERADLLDVDEYLFRSWFSLLPLKSLVPYMENFTEHLTRCPARVLDCLVGVSYRLQGLRTVYSNHESVERVFTMLLQLLDIFQDKVLEEASLQSFLTVCSKLHETVCRVTRESRFYALPALSAAVVSQVLLLQPLVGPAEDQGELAEVRLARTAFQGTLAATRAWLQRVLQKSMLRSAWGSPVSFSYPKEIEVWRRLVEINFPAELGWKESLLGDMEGRLRKEKPLSQILAYCSTHWGATGPQDSVSQSFEKCAIEAVSSACQSQTSILEDLSGLELWKFGTLVSAVITKAWPRDGGRAVDDFEAVFKYLLTGPDVEHLFKLYETDEKVLASVTEEGKTLMATADSVFTRVAGDLLNGTVTVGQLELIMKHRRQFLGIWQLKRKSLPQEECCDVTEVLSWRKRELEFLRREWSCVDSLLRQCEKVQHLVQVDLGELTERHAEDLSRKRLSDAVTVRLHTASDVTWTTHYSLSPWVREMAEMVDLLRDSHVFQLLWTEAAKLLGACEEPEAAEPLSDSEEEPARQRLQLQDVYESLYRPCYERFFTLYQSLKSGEVTFAEIDVLFKDFLNRYDALASDLQVMCSVDIRDQRDWVEERVWQITEYHHLHQAVSSARVILQVKEALGLTGDFGLLHTLVNFEDDFDNFRHGTLDRISQELISAKRLLQDVSEARCRCLKELALRRDFVSWVREALAGINELKVFVDLASISAGESDIDVDRVACFHDAVQGYASLLYKLDGQAGFEAFMGHLQELWNALDNDQHLPSKLRDSARNLEWLKTVKESHGSVELSSLSLAAAINSRGVYVIEVPGQGRKVSPDTVLHLRLPEGTGGGEEVRNYSLEELKELLNKLMLMSGKKERSSAEVDRFSEVFCNVQRLVQAFTHLFSAGNMLFRAWTAEVRCCPRENVCVWMDFGLELMSPLAGAGDVIEQLEAVCRQMEDSLDRWEKFVAGRRREHFYLNFYTAEQLVYLSMELKKQVPSQAALVMLSFIKAGCTPSDVATASRGHEDRVVSARVQAVTEGLPQVLASEHSLEGKLRVVMEQAMECAAAFLPHHLDLEALGRCLAQLARMGGPPVERHLPRGLQAGQPNLVLCSHSEVLPAALAIYTQAPHQPLPTFDEVLVCSPRTTFEEVELLLRRCLAPGSPGHKVYSLLFADQLSYEVGYRAEELFQNLRKQCHREDYQLVMVCDADREHCYLPSAFGRHRVLITPQAPLELVQAYLASHYQVPEQTPSAAAVFGDRMCVGIVASERAGVGKSLYVSRLHGRLQERFHTKEVRLKVIRLIDPQVDENYVLGALLPFLDARYQKAPMIFHIDVTSSVQSGIWVFLFKLLVLQYLMDINGKMWLRSPGHLYVVEITEGTSGLPKRPSTASTRGPQFSFLDIFPKVTCRPPKEVINMELAPGRSFGDPGMDQLEFCSETFQRPYQYLTRFHQKQNLDTFRYEKGSVEGTPEECLQHFLIYCGVIDPSWSELRNFARFLNYQLKDCEASLFCDPHFVGDTLQGFKNFVVTFMVWMARDFATPTLHTSDQSPGQCLVDMDGVKEEDLAPFSLRRRWESEPHPYIFFNSDHTSMTFIGFHLQPNADGGVDAIDQLSGQVIRKGVMSAGLYQGLLHQRVPFNVDFDSLPRHEKLERLCLALGIQWPIDPDDTYELTTDNMLKILAIEMRFRCGIPVVVMGETGCGKTRLIRFLSDLRRGGAPTETLRLVKVHGGTTADMIYSRVREAEDVAFFNMNEYQLDTILFFDEANTTEAIGCIKEVLCDRTVDGWPLAEDSGLHVIAACNPYRKHSQETICRLEAAGLGYRVSAQETAERLGSIPLRQLVYRVHALPPGLVPLLWDFGQLDDAAERLYIQQMVQRLVGSAQLQPHEARVLTEVLSASQAFMRRTEDECRFVSLRDVERCVKVFEWFHSHSEMLLWELSSFLGEPSGSTGGVGRQPVLWSLVLAIGVCYHASLEKKDLYRRAVCRFFPEPYNDSKLILDEILRVQDLFLNGVPLRKTIARNAALKENVFMMVLCIELKIPLFLVGKPGSSKSLAKTIVAEAMQGQAAHSSLFRSLKQVHLVSFQCSPHSTPQGIIGTFRQCARFQQGKDLQQYVSVVVLDEVGLAEDSPKMPLKALHPLLEDGCIEDDPAPHKKVGFVGISNWALDPAKMNRGIFVSRGSPSKQELIESARGICSSDSLVKDRVQGYFGAFAKAYETVCRLQDKEFFGLRDYYSLIKMVFARAKAANRKPSPQDIAEAVLRNFSGKDDIQALDIFTASLPEARCLEEVSTLQLIQQNISVGPPSGAGGELEDTESRYLLVLTKNYVALQILQQAFFRGGQQPEVIFGSSFPRDQEYTQICRNINRVKICMEAGKTVVLLNLQSLYESLYDALNQYYVYLGGQQYVDLGLGTHRVKCRVHPDFRLIVIEEKEVVYRHFPIPLVNRLEKHYLDIHTVLATWQKNVAEELRVWVEKFVDVRAGQVLATPRYSPADVFIGYHSDTCASVVLQVTERQGLRDVTEELYQRVLEEAQLILLDCATPDAVVRLRNSALGAFAAQALAREYFYKQQHSSFADFLQAHLRGAAPGHRAVFTEITTFSRLLTSQDCEVLGCGGALSIKVLSLQQFETEQSFLKEVRKCLTHTAGTTVLIIQLDFEDGVRSAQLSASARYSAINEINNIQGDSGRIFVYFITKLSRMGGDTSFVGFRGGLWRSVHIDDLQRSTLMVSDVTRLQSISISQLFEPGDTPEQESPGEADLERDMEPEAGRGGGVVEEVTMETEGPEKMEDGAPALEGPDVLDTTRLLRSCVQGAVGLLRDQGAGCRRAMRRVEGLLTLLSEDDTHSASFLRVSKMRVYDLLKRQETYMYTQKEWVVREASNQTALQEAGTFRHTLWKRVQDVVTPVLASVTAFIDRDCNLELLLRPDSPRWAKALWMFVFQDIKLLSIPLVLSNTRSTGDMSYILVPNYMALPGGTANDFPFSWRIKDYLEELWVQAQYIKNVEGPSKQLVEIFRQTPLGTLLAQLPGEEQQDALQRYVRDFLLLTMGVSSQEELQFLQRALWSCIWELRAASGRSEEELSLPWVHLAYQHFRSRLQNFSRIVTIHPPVLRSLIEATRHHDLSAHEMTLDALAAQACMEMLSTDTLRPSPRAWLQLVRRLSVPLELICSDGYAQGSGSAARATIRTVRGQWNRIFSVALFVEHVLLGTEAQVPELHGLVTEHVFLLDKCLQENSDIKTHRPFEAVMATLCDCKDKASKSLARFGVNPCPICLGDAQDPVCLPCDHVYCLPCIRAWLTPGQMMCPSCRAELPGAFSLAVSQEHRRAIEKHAEFRQMCNSFFVDLVSTVCFKDNRPPQRRVVESLLSLLFIQKELLRDAAQRHREHTKSLSPFNDVVDKTPVIRSVVLKLLLKYSFHDVKGYIQDYLSLLEKKAFMIEDKTELYLLFISCLEDSIHEKLGACSGNSELDQLREEGRFLRACSPARCGQGPARETSVEYLQETARIRLCLDRASDIISEHQGGSEVPEGKQRYLQHVEHFCTRSHNDWFRVYLVRKLSSQRGTEFVQGLSREGHPLQWVFPKEVIAQQKDHPGQMDRYLVYGDEYRALRNAVGTAVLECRPLAIETALKACRTPQTHQAVYLLLALFKEVAALYRSPNANLHPTPEQREAVGRFIEDSEALSLPAIRQFAASLVTNTLPLLTMGSSDDGLGWTVTEMAVHAAAVLLCGQNNALEPLKNLAFSAASMANAFLPTMPEDLLAQAKSWQGLEGVQWYTCPNGHPCSVGECGKPMEQSYCVDCGTPIGGINHRPQAGFHIIANDTDRTQTGHVLGDPQHRGVAVTSDRALSPAVFILIRLLTHLAMLLGAAQSPQALSSIIKPPVRDLGRFLQQHVQRDLEQLTQTLGKSADETVNAVHLVLGSLLRNQHPSSGQRFFSFDAKLSTKQNRNNWEKYVEALVSPELKRLDTTLPTVSTRISQDERISSNPVVRLVHGDPVTFLPHLPQTSVVHCSKIWSCREKTTVEHLRQIVEQKNGKETVPVLWRFLQKEAELRLVRFLPEILALQRSLVKQFQNVSEVNFGSIQSFISSHNSDGLRQLLHDRIAVFLSTWNKLRCSLETSGEIKLPGDYCSTDLDLHADFEVLLPRRRGQGLCSTALVSYLIRLHNEMVYTVEKFSEENSSYTVSASEVMDLHVISYEVERDLIPVILSNRQYQVEQGGQTLQEFDLEKIQRQLTSRLLQGKPRLTLEGLPTLVYRHERNYEHLFKDIKDKMQQEPCPSSAISAISGQLQSYSDACEALCVVEVMLGFLSTAGGDPHMHLDVYIRDLLRMGDQTALVLQALGRCQLKHIIALWKLLSAHKSEQLLRLKKEPFGEISPKYKAALSPENKKLLSTFLSQADLDTFLLELHEMMVLDLKNPQNEGTFQPEWSLRSTLVSCMERRESDIPPEVEFRFPEEIPLSNCVSVWKMAAGLKQDRQAR